jgi:PAS domain-containing protein
MVSEDPPRHAAPVTTSGGDKATSCIRDLLSVFRLSTSWVDKSCEHMAADAARALAEMLQLEFAAVQFSASPGAEALRHSCAKDDASELTLDALTQMNFPWPAGGVSDWRSPSGGPLLRVARVPVGLEGDGWLFAGSSRRHFPENQELVLIYTCANQIAVALQYCRLQTALRESEERFRKFAEYSANVLWILDANPMRIEYLSSAFGRIWGQAPETMLGAIDCWASTIYPEDRNDVLAALDSVLRNSESAGSAICCFRSGTPKGG